MDERVFALPITAATDDHELVLPGFATFTQFLRHKCGAQKTHDPEGHYCGNNEQRHQQLHNPAFD